MNLKALAIRGVFWSVIQKWGGLFFHALSLLILTRLLMPEAFGLVALANVVIALIRIFVEQGFAQAIVQAKHIQSDYLDTAFWTSLVTSLVFSLCVFFGANFVAQQFHEPELVLILQSLSPVFILIALSSVQTALLQRQLEFKALAIRSLIALSVSGFLAVFLALAGFGVWSLVVQELTRSFIAMIVLWQVGKWRPRLKFSLTALKQLMSFGISIVGINILNVVNRRSDDLLIGYFLGTTALGYYNVAYQALLLMTQLINAPVNQVAFSAFAKLQENPTKLRKAFYDGAKVVSLVSIPAFFFLVTLAPNVISLLFGEQWEPSIPVMRVLALIGPIHALGGLDSNLLIALGKPAWRLGFNFLNAMINFPAFYFAVRWGILAVAIAYVVRGYILFPLPLIAIKKLAKISYNQYVYSIMPILLSGLIAAAVSFIIAHLGRLLLPNWFLLLSSVILGLVTYSICLFYLSPKTLTQLPKLVRHKIS